MRRLDNFKALLDAYTEGTELNAYEDAEDLLKYYNCSDLAEFVEDSPTYYTYYYDMVDYYTNRGEQPEWKINEAIKEYFNQQYREQ